MISTCIITKDEAQMLDKCLSALQKFNSEIVVVDTGSKDNSVDIALKYTPNVYTYKWNDNFAMARNYSISLAHNDAILVLDTDEIINDADFNELEKLSRPDGIGRILRINEYTRNGEHNTGFERIGRFFDRRYFTYKGRIHEQLVPINNNKYSTYNIPITVKHYGYEGDAEKIKEKVFRNEQLLLLDLKEFGDDPYILYQLGKSCYMSSRYDEANQYFGKALGFDLNPELEYVQDMVETYGYSLVNSGNSAFALQLLGNSEVYSAFSKTADFCFIMGLIYMNCELFDKAVEQFIMATGKNARIEGTNSYKAYYNAGIIRECQGRIPEAKKLYQKCGNYDKALYRLSQL